MQQPEKSQNIEKHDAPQKKYRFGSTSGVGMKMGMAVGLKDGLSVGMGVG
jgi:hypothetical protein